MRKTVLIFGCIAAWGLGIGQAQDLESILDHFFEATGQKQLLKMNTMVATGKTLQMDMEMPFKSINKRPDKAYLEVDIQGAPMKQAYDGKSGWMIAPWTGSADPIDLVGPDLKSVQDMANMDGNLWNYKEKGHQLELQGTEDLDGTEVYVLKLTRNDGDIEYYYIDSENFVVLKMVRRMMVNDQETEIEILQSNYQEVDGVVIPFTSEQNFGGQPGMTIMVEKVEFNREVNDSIFSKPAPATVE